MKRMKTVNLAEAKAHLSELVELASKGEAVQILRNAAKSDREDALSRTVRR